MCVQYGIFRAQMHLMLASQWVFPVFTGSFLAISLAVCHLPAACVWMGFCSTRNISEPHCAEAQRIGTLPIFVFHANLLFFHVILKFEICASYLNIREIRCAFSFAQRWSYKRVGCPFFRSFVSDIKTSVQRIFHALAAALCVWQIAKMTFHVI